MAFILFKWFFAAILAMPVHDVHPFYVSVVEIEHNAKDKTLEISCKIFTDDLEKTLREAYKKPVDLLSHKNKPAMEKLVSDYVQKHLQLTVDGKAVAMKFLGYEQIEEGIYSYYQADQISSMQKLEVTDNILYEYKTEQIGLLHVTVNGKRQSTKLNNPADKAVFTF